MEKWDDVAGLEKAKQELKECVLLPIKFPQLFEGEIQRRSFLLYGPPGTGKSLLAKAICTEVGESKFFSVNSTDLLSRWLGGNEKQLKNLFESARISQPSVIFIDEVDLLSGGFGEDESENTRRIKTEFLVQMGFLSSNDKIFVLGTTKAPWRLDAAMRRRFEKRIFIPLPEKNARNNMFKLHIGNITNTLNEEDFNELAERSEGYSGSDISVVVRDALMTPIRIIQRATHFKRVSGPSRKDPTIIHDDLLTPCSPSDSDAIEMTWTNIDADKLMEPIISKDDIFTSLNIHKATVTEKDLEKHITFTEEFGNP